MKKKNVSRAINVCNRRAESRGVLEKTYFPWDIRILGDLTRSSFGEGSSPYRRKDFAEVAKWFPQSGEIARHAQCLAAQPDRVGHS
jgi:hypothetical protein